MSKGSSHLFSGTSGEGKALIDEVIANGYKISPEKVVLITRDPTGKIVWLEEGNSSSGLQHIIDRHGHECMNLFTTDKPNELPFKLAVTGIL